MSEGILKFSSLHVRKWRQFDSVTVPLHSKLTVITGANGAGKTTLLSFLIRHFGWSRPFLATPLQGLDGSTTYATGLFAFFLHWMKNSERRESLPHEEIGEIVYSNGTSAKLTVPTTSDLQYEVSIHGQQGVQGIYVSSHRVLSQYQVISSIPTAGINAQQAYGTFHNEIYNRYHGGHSGFSPVYRMKEALLAMATFGEGNRYVKGKPDLLAAYLGFIAVLRKILPVSLGFETLEIRSPDIVLRKV